MDECILNSEDEQEMSSQILQTQKKNQKIDLQELFERYSNVLPVGGSSRAKNGSIWKSSNSDLLL